MESSKRFDILENENKSISRKFSNGKNIINNNENRSLIEKDIEKKNVQGLCKTNSYEEVSEFLKTSGKNKIDNKINSNKKNKNGDKNINTKKMKSQGYLSNSSWAPSQKKKNRKNSILNYETDGQSKKLYFKQIKAKNIQNTKKLMNKRRLEFIFKFIFYIVSNVMNILSVITYILQTYFEKKTDDPSSAQVLVVTEYLEIIFSYYFLCELFLFLYMKRKHPFRYIFSLDFLIDFVTIFPPIFSSFIDNRLFRFQFIRILRIFRVFRILRVYKTLKNLQIENSVTTAEDESGYKLNPIKLQFYTILVILFCNFFICAGLILGLNDLIIDAFNKQDMNFFDSFYFVIVTSSTLGYGDIIPTHPVTRLLIIMSLFSLVIIVSNQVSKLSLILRTWGPDSCIYKCKEHLILVLDSSINYIYVLQSLQKKYEHKEIIIISKENLILFSPLLNLNKIKLIHVLDYDLEAFDRANIKNAMAILIFTEKVTFYFDHKEKIVDFLLLKLQRFYSEIPIYLQTLFSDRSSFTTNIKSKNLRFKKIVPIMKIKSLIESKSLFNPGFACFIQNLIFNDTRIPDDYETYNPLMKNYFFGTENKIVIKNFPKYFYNMQFSEAVYIVYLKSIAAHFVKIQTNDKQTNRGILLIGIMEKNKFNVYDKEEVKIFPEKYIIKPKSQGVFISYNGLNYVEKFFESFEHIIEESAESKFSLDKKPKTNKKHDPLNLDLIMSDDPNRIAKKNFYRRSAIIDTINNNIFKISTGFVNEKPFFNLHPNEIIKENEEENINSSIEVKKEELKKKITKTNLKHCNTLKEEDEDLKKNSTVKSNYKQDESLKNKESSKIIKDEYCVEKNKRNSLTIRKMSQKFDSEFDVKAERNRHDNFINSFLNKYEISSNELMNKSNGFNKNESKSSLEDKSFKDVNVNKKNNKNPFSNKKLKFFNEIEDLPINNEKRKKSRKKESKRSNSKLRSIKRFESSKKFLLNDTKNITKKSDVLILNENKITSSYKNKKSNYNNYEKLNEEERIDLTNAEMEMSVSGSFESYVSFVESHNSGSDFSSFFNNFKNHKNRRNSQKFFSPSMKDKKDSLSHNAKTKSDKLFLLKDENKPREEDRNSTKEKQPSTKLISEIDDELRKIDNSSLKLPIEIPIADKNKNINKLNEFQSNAESKNNNLKRINSVSHNYLENNYYAKTENIPKQSKKTFFHSTNNVLNFNRNNKARRSSLASDINTLNKFEKKNFKEDFQTNQGTQKFSDSKSNRRYSLDENSLYKINLSNLKRGSVIYSNNSILKNLIFNRDDTKSLKSKSLNSSNFNASEHNLTGVNKHNYYNKMQVLNSSSSVCKDEHEEDEEEEENKFKKSNRGIIYDKTNFKIKNTKRNLDFLNKFEQIYDKKIMEEITKKNEEHYSELKNLVYRSAENDYIFEHRIFEIDKVKAQDIFSSHILLIGYQDALDKFVKLMTYHFPKKAICFLGTEDQKLIICNKLLKQYKNVYFFQGDPTNPFHLLNAGLNNAYQVVILSETIFKKLNEDMSALLSSRLIDYYFDINMITELWDCKSAKLLGYIPLDKKAQDIQNEFYHPLFMSGKLIYLSHLDKLTTLSVTDPNVIETLYQIISVGFRKFVNNLANRRSDINRRFIGDVPVIITIDLPEHYWGKEYYALVQDLLTLEKPAIPFGLYITDPLSYHLLDSQGKISQSQKNHFWKIINSHKRKLINLESMGRFESAYFDNMKFLRDISYTDKIVLNYVDLKRTHLPIFITNPLPGFILTKDCKVLIMSNYSPNLRGLNLNDKETRKDLHFHNLKKTKKKQQQEIPIDDKIRQCQENYIKLLDNLNKQFTSNYIEALKNAEKMKKEESVQKEQKN